MNFHNLIAIPLLFLITLLAGVLLVAGFALAMVIVVPVGLTILTTEAAVKFFLDIISKNPPFPAAKTEPSSMPPWRRECQDWVEKHGY